MAVTMESLSDVEVEDINDKPFEFDGRPYLFEPEYTDEELLALALLSSLQEPWACADKLALSAEWIDS